ncbi:Zinc-binding dehydrogenase [Apiospora rasikravindrae]|uniref:Zinc-binding dehydrogenase n=1 Tax=Apiospora rasikravindrae TaxID=990691 RepID=A0ABR1S1X5_9PEZI
MPENRAAYLMGEKIRPLAVKAAPYTSPGPNQILVRVAAVAVNPIEYIKQDLGGLLYGWVKCPHVLGSDVAGTVVEVGSGEEAFRPGDRVVGQALGSEKKFNDSAMGAFQHYVLLQANMVSPIPDSMSFERAVVLPLALSTASCGLFQKDQLALRLPVVAAAAAEEEDGAEKKTEKETLLIWGGSTSVGCNAIQLACAAGYEVVTTCSPRNFDLVQSLGAAAAFDYGDADAAVSEIVKFCQGKKVVGALSMGGDAGRGCVEVLRQIPQSSSRRFLSRVSYATPENKDAGLPARIWCMLSFSVWLWAKSVRHGIKSNVVVGTTLEANEVSKAIYEDFLPRALATGQFVAAPEPEVVGKGLEFVQTALDTLRRGVSAKKLVVEI